MDISELVKDWGGFERFVAQLNDTGEVRVEHNVALPGRSGAPRQIDVVIRHTQGLYEHLIVAECKFWNTPVERLHVDALSTTVREVGASKGVIFSTKGFQSGAIAQARHDGIDLFTVRELSESEWGQAGRVFDMFLQINTVSLANIQMAGIHLAGGLSQPSTPLSISLGSDDTRSKTPIHFEGKPDKTLEALIERAARESAVKVWPSNALGFESGYDGEAGCRAHVKIAPTEPIRLLRDELEMIVNIEFDIGVRTDQSRLQIDRSQNYLFAVAVEDCVKQTVKGASRRPTDNVTTLFDIKVMPPDNSQEFYQNGSLLKIWSKGFASFDDFINIEPGRIVVFSQPSRKADAASTVVE